MNQVGCDEIQTLRQQPHDECVLILARTSIYIFIYTISCKMYYYMLWHCPKYKWCSNGNGYIGLNVWTKMNTRPHTRIHIYVIISYIDSEQNDSISLTECHITLPHYDTTTTSGTILYRQTTQPHLYIEMAILFVCFPAKPNNYDNQCVFHVS